MIFRKAEFRPYFEDDLILRITGSGHSHHSSIEKGRAGECYLMSGKYITMSDMIHMVNKATRKKRKAILIPIWVAYAVLPFVKLVAFITGKDPLFTNETLHILRHGNTKISFEKAKREIGYSPRPLQQTANDTMQWFKQNGYI